MVILNIMFLEYCRKIPDFSKNIFCSDSILSFNIIHLTFNELSQKF